MIYKEFGIRERGIYYTPRPGAYGICFKRESDQTLLALVDTEVGFFLPGGGIEEGENHQTCLKREFIEETGYTIEIGAYIGSSSQSGFTPRSKKHICLEGNFYLVELKDHVGGQVEEDHQLVWIDVQKAIQIIHLEYQSYAISEGLLIFEQ